MFLPRLLSFVILIILFGLSIFLKNWIGLAIFGGIFTIAAFGLTYEILSMLEKKGCKSYKLTTSMTAAFLIIGIVNNLSYHFLLIIPGILMITMWIQMLNHRKFEEALDRMIHSAAALMMGVLPLSFLIAIYMMGEGTTYSGRWLVVALVLTTKAGDTGAYCVGMLYHKISGGRNHKIVPNISPKKSWEGTIGGCICSIAVSILLFNNGLVNDVIVGMLLFFGGFYGDLVESALKRTCGVKDSGSVIPGMGGVYDVLDSLLLNAPLFYFYLILKNLIY
jgi:phosphatidate cytidylyltransferase